MAGKARYDKVNRPVKYPVRKKNYCKICARSRGYYRKFGICRICFRELASQGLIPGVRKASW